VPDEYAKMIRKAQKLARKGDLQGIKQMQKEYFQWASAIANVWRFENRKEKEQQ